VPLLLVPLLVSLLLRTEGTQVLLLLQLVRLP
jgi:hypothetical protein